MNKEERLALNQLRKYMHKNDVFVRIIKAYCKAELNYSLDIESLFINLDGITKNQEKMCKILDKFGL